MRLSRKLVAAVAVAGLALAGWAGAASGGMLPEGIDMGLAAEAKARKCDRADARAEGAGLATCEGAHARHGGGEGQGPRGPKHPHAPPPPFRMANGTVEGRWVAFEAGEDGVRAYTSRGPFAEARVFDAVTLEGAGEGEHDGARVRGPVWLARQGEVAAAAFNAPNAFLGVLNRGAGEVTVTYDLAEGVQASALDEGGVRLARDAHAARLVVRGDAVLAVEEGLVTATLGEGGAVAFAIEGFPHLLEHQLRALGGHGPGPRGETPPAPSEEDAAEEGSA